MLLLPGEGAEVVKQEEEHVDDKERDHKEQEDSVCVVEAVDEVDGA